MVAKNGGHRYETKLRHCHPVYRGMPFEQELRAQKLLEYTELTVTYFVPYLCQLVLVAILWVKPLEMFYSRLVIMWTSFLN